MIRTVLMVLLVLLTPSVFFGQTNEYEVLMEINSNLVYVVTNMTSVVDASQSLVWITSLMLGWIMGMMFCGCIAWLCSTTKVG